MDLNFSPLRVPNNSFGILDTKRIIKVLNLDQNIVFDFRFIKSHIIRGYIYKKVDFY